MLGAYLALIDNEPDKKLLEALYIAFKNVMYNTAYSITHDVHLSEDAVMDSFFALARNMDKLKDMTMSQSRNYLIMAVRNRAVDICRKRSHTVYDEDVIDEIPDSGSTVIDAENKQLQEKVFGIIKDLDCTYSDVVMMKYYYGFKTSEIASSLGITQDNVTKRLSRAKTMIRRKMAEEGAV